MRCPQLENVYYYTGFLCGECTPGENGTSIGVDLTLIQCKDCKLKDTLLVVFIGKEHGSLPIRLLGDLDISLYCMYIICIFTICLDLPLSYHVDTPILISYM